MTTALPSLPVPAIEPSKEFAGLGGTFGALYIADQMRAYATEAIKAEREACAELLDRIAADFEKASSFFERNAVDYCATAIRERKDPQ